MKSPFVKALLVIAAFVSVLSCKDPLTLDETKWTVESFQDIFAGTVVNSGEVEGSLIAYKDAGEVIMYLTVEGFGWNNALFEPGDYTIVKYTNDELVLDLLYYEYTNVKRADCEYLDTYKGKRIYVATAPSYEGGYDYYVYFKVAGTAVDVGRSEYADEDGYYFYDTTRIYCKRAQETEE